MLRVHVVVEGQTEETFVRQVLAPVLGALGVFLYARSVETSSQRAKTHRGGVLDYGQVKRDLFRWMKEDDGDDSYFTTMIDLYRLPSDFPRFTDAARLRDPYARVAALEEALQADVGHRRFISYLQLHEFEALLLADPVKLTPDFGEHSPRIRKLVQLAASYASPELIDDGPETSPSKRIIRELPGYAGRKVSVGPATAERIGLDQLRQKCRHFHEWLARLEALGGGNA